MVGSSAAMPRFAVRQPTCPSVTMLEAFGARARPRISRKYSFDAPPPPKTDLLPIVDCLKLDNMDAVQVCMDRLEPWLELTETGDINFSLNAVNGFIGGTVGVIGTVIAAGIKKDQVKERLQCVYCEGSGQIMCGHCLGTGKISYYNEALGELVLGETCPNCEGTGTVVCINCQGSGMSVPDDFLQVLGDEEVRAAAARANTHTPHPSPFPFLPHTPSFPSLRLDSPRRTTSDYSTRHPSRKAARPP